MCELATLWVFTAVLSIFWLKGNAWFCEMLDQGCSKGPTQKFRSKSRGYSLSLNEPQIKGLMYWIFLTVYGSFEAERMQKDLAVHWEHFSDFTFYIQVLLLRHSSDFGVTDWVAIS